MWISHVPHEEARVRLKQLYDRVKWHGDYVDNIMLAHSLRPHSMDGHITLYKYVLHHPWLTPNTLAGRLASIRSVSRVLLSSAFLFIDRGLGACGRKDRRALTA